MNNLVFLEPNCLDEIPFTTSKVIAENGKGHVYIIETDNGIKIGRTINIESRINTLRTQSGRKFKRVCFTSQCRNYGDIETAMHRLFKESRVIGEWFNVPFVQASKELAMYDLDTSSKEIETSLADLLNLMILLAKNKICNFY